MVPGGADRATSPTAVALPLTLAPTAAHGAALDRPPSPASERSLSPVYNPDEAAAPPSDWLSEGERHPDAPESPGRVQWNPWTDDADAGGSDLPYLTYGSDAGGSDARSFGDTSGED